MDILNYVYDDYIKRKLPNNQAPFSIKLSQHEYNDYKTYEETHYDAQKQLHLIQVFVGPDGLADHIQTYLFNEGYIIQSNNPGIYILTEKGIKVKKLGSVSALEFYLNQQEELDVQLKLSTLDTNKISLRLTKVTIGVSIIALIIAVIGLYKTISDTSQQAVKEVLDSRLQEINNSLLQRNKDTAVIICLIDTLKFSK